MNKRSPPPELNQPFPRRFRISGSFKFTITLITVMLLVSAILPHMMEYINAHKIAILKTRGVATEGNVVNRYAVPVSLQNGGLVYLIDYRFQPAPVSSAPVTVYQATDNVTAGEYENAQIGQIVPIIYDPSQPGRAALNFNDRVHTNDPYYWMFIVIAIGGAVVAGAPNAS